MFDTVAATDDTKIAPWIIIDGKAAGTMYLTSCATGSENAAMTVRFYKLKAFRDYLIALAPYDFK
jgi:hypothetical protein